jgi:hypothetical protein
VKIQKVIVGSLLFLVFIAAGYLLGKLSAPAHLTSKTYTAPPTSTTSRAFAISTTSRASAISPTSRASTISITAAEVAQKAERAKKSLGVPRRVDSDTWLVDVRAEGNQVVLVHRIELSFRNDPSQDKAGLDLLRPIIAKQICHTPGLVNMLNAGLVYTYRYHDKTGRKIGDISFGSGDCALQ